MQRRRKKEREKNTGIGGGTGSWLTTLTESGLGFLIELQTTKERLLCSIEQRLTAFVKCNKKFFLNSERCAFYVYFLQTIFVYFTKVEKFKATADLENIGKNILGKFAAFALRYVALRHEPIKVQQCTIWILLKDRYLKRLRKMI